MKGAPAGFAGDDKTGGVMEIKQRKQKIPLLIFFLIICISMILFGVFAPDSQFPDDAPRSAFVFLGVFCTITSTLWFFFGSIDWSTWNLIKKSLGNKEVETDANDQEEPDQ